MNITINVLSRTMNQSIVYNDQRMNFQSAFLQAADCHAPVIQKRVRGLDLCPWLTGEIISIHHREYLLGTVHMTRAIPANRADLRHENLCFSTA